MAISKVRLGAIFVGWITAMFLMLMLATAIVAYVITSGIDLASLTHNVSRFTMLSFGFLIILAVFSIFFIGGYVAGRMSALAGPLNGAMVLVTSIIAAILAITFAVTFGNKLGVNVLAPILSSLASQSMIIFVLTAFAFIGSIVGGKFGEGYIDRLDLALGIAKPAQIQPVPKKDQKMPTPKIYQESDKEKAGDKPKEAAEDKSKETAKKPFKRDRVAS
ncbi:MAG: hypothetical protein K6T91_06135 [Firmicutes bacterium]|nr:hypothetical protein [Bacillota bacterium]